MTLRNIQLAAITMSVIASGALAQTSFPEIEPNANKAEATTNGTITLVAGDSITGTSTGTSTTALSTLVTTIDQFRIKTGALPLGIYKHELVITTTGTAGHTGTLRGLNQTGTVGVGGTAGTVDTTIQTSLTTTTPPRKNVWYGFGKQEELYYRVAGTTATTAPYVATLATTPVTATVIAPAFEAANPISISTIGLTTVDTFIHVYDGTFTAIPGASNDDNFGGANAQSLLTRTYAPGTYYVTIGSFNTAWNLPAPADDDFVTDALMDFPDVIARSSSTTPLDLDFKITGSNGFVTTTNQLVAGRTFEMDFFQFTVQAGAAPIVPPAPANDNCAAAISVGTGGTLLGTTAGATNDGAASCDPGGAASKDVWYSYTNATTGVRLLTATTCGTTAIDTVLSVYSGTCGALTEVACSDDGAACGATLSSVTGVSVAVGQTVLIRVSDKGLSPITQGDFTLVTSVVAPPPANDGSATPTALAGPGLYPLDNLGATTGTEGQTEAACLFFTFTSIQKDVWYTYTPTTNGLVEFTTCGFVPVPPSPSADTKIAIYAGAGCPTAGTAIACNDDAGNGTGSPVTCTATGQGLATTIQFTATCGVTYTIQIGMYGGSTSSALGQFQVTETGGSTCATPVTYYCFGDGTGTACPCGNTGATGNGCGNGINANGANLAASGIASVSGDTWLLSGSGVPNGPGLYFQGANQLGGGLGVLFGDGLRCTGGNVIRLGIVIAAGNASTYPSGVTPPNNIPISVKGFATAGAVINYQLWYRDSTDTGGGPGSFCTPSAFNMSNAVNVTWTP